MMGLLLRMLGLLPARDRKKTRAAQAGGSAVDFMRRRTLTGKPPRLPVKAAYPPRR